jgi:hypothetical protein
MYPTKSACAIPCEKKEIVVTLSAMDLKSRALLPGLDPCLNLVSVLAVDDDPWHKLVGRVESSGGLRILMHERLALRQNKHMIQVDKHCGLMVP